MVSERRVGHVMVKQSAAKSRCIENPPRGHPKARSGKIIITRYNQAPCVGKNTRNLPAPRKQYPQMSTVVGTASVSL